MSSKPVDTAIVMVVGPVIDDTDFKSLEEAIAYNAAGMDISLIVEKTDGTSTVTAITLTTGGTSDWTHKDGGYYEVEITAAQNAEEGIAYLRGVCTGVLPFESVARYDIVKANIYDSLIKGTDVLQVDVTQLLGTAWLAPGVAGTPDVNAKLIGATAQTGRDIGASVLLSPRTGAGQLDITSGIVKSNLTQILSHLLTQTGTQLADGFEHFFDVATPTGTVDSLPAAAPNAAGGLPISAAGGLAMDTLADWIDGGRLDLLLDAIPTTAMRGTDSATLAATWTDARAGYLDNLSAGAVALASGVDLTSIHGAALTETVNGYLAAAFTKLFDVATPLLVSSEVMRGTDGANTTVPDAAGIAATPAEVATALTDINLDHLVKIAVDTNFATTVHLDSVIGQLADVGTSATFDRTTDSQEGIRNKQTDIETDTAEIGTAGAGLTDLGGMSTGMKAEIESEANDALVAVHLDHLLAVDYDPASKPGVATALLNELVENDGGVSRYTANALEQAPSGGTNPNVLIDTTISGAPSSQTVFVLTAGSDIDDAYKDQAIVLYDASNNDYPSVRKVSDYTGATKTVTLDSAPDFTIIAGDGVKTFVTAPGTTAPTVGQIRAEMEGVGYFLDLIKADTNELQTDWVNGGRLDLILDIIAADTTTDIPALIATAQADLNLLTGADGATLATLQGNYAPNKVIPDVAGTLATYDPPTNTEMVAAFTEIKGATWAATDTLEAIRDRGDAEWMTATGFSTHSAADVKTAIEAAGSHLALILADTGTDGVLIAATATSAQLVDDIVDEVITGATHNVADSLGRRLREIHDGTVVEEETAQAGSASTITLAASANANDDFYNKSQLKIISGAGAGQTRSFKDYNGTTKVATACEDWVVTPDNTSKYVITGHACTAVFELNNGIYGLINAEVKDCLTIDTIADSYATDGAQPTIAQGILAIQQMLQEKSIAGTTLTVKKPDGSTVAMTFTLDSATAPTSITRAT
jgi:hypothetical protein